MTKHGMLRTSLSLFLLLCFFLLPFTVLEASAGQADDPYARDVKVFLSSRSAMAQAIAFVDAQPDIFPKVAIEENGHFLNRQQRMTALQAWQNFLDHLLFLDSMGHVYAEIFHHSQMKGEKENAFYLTFACFLAQYRYAMDYIYRMEKNPDMQIILNQADPELGLNEKTYDEVKFRFLNVIRAAEFARLHVVYLYYSQRHQNPLQLKMEEDIAEIWRMGEGTGPVLTAQNALQVIENIGFTAWFPVQKSVSQIMGNIKIWRSGTSLISSSQIEHLKAHLQPGDILLQRREWYATNLGIPGFWTHAAVYIGTPQERTHFFSGPDIKQWLMDKGAGDGKIDSLLIDLYPRQYRLSITAQEQGHMPRVVEAIAEGVTFTTLEHSAAADSLVVLRPNLPRLSIAQALIKAYQYSGRPYDFNFDFRTDSELVCSELVYKIYEPTDETVGLSFPLTEVLNRPLLSPNEIARIFDAEYGSDMQRLFFVFFLDGNEKARKATESTVEQFRASWKRPKWHIWVQDTTIESVREDQPIVK